MTVQRFDPALDPPPDSTFDPAAAPDLATIGAQAETRLAALAPKAPLSFGFDWRGIAFNGRIGPEQPTALRLFGTLGGLPYSAEDLDRRIAALTLVGRSNNPRFERTVNNRLTVAFETPFDRSLDALGIVTAITLALIGVRDALEAARALLAKPRLAVQATGA